ncbi:kinetochore protein SPC25 homolog [Populus alba]|uniref:Kinetochore protein SPC25 n=2 Tax=Populus TaxID=3689 RepID=A0A4U5Q857_POPAL|nr:kinetochore protein SPC25 homolog [Populus alba]XP_034925928.1 kinetochore protein SPC25 homolog [Populus alba]XP_034925929.1 kinetochore protein SPC25 homolog [Populus alba]KAJ6970557.1 kinetochore protein SPC25 [Populus alba x Populus x berolinensis]TKS06480.1 hypothetical protein D5086_0000124210 [Populus alba]
MEWKGTETVRAKMESLRLICDRDAQIQLQKMDSFTASFSNSMDSVKARAEETVQNQGKLGSLKSSLKEADGEFVKVLAVKTQKEAKQLVTRDSISATRARIQKLQKSVQVQRARRDEHAAIMSQQSLALATSKETEHQDIDHKREIQEAMLWYNMVLGFKIEGGRGVKFTFNNINLKNPYEEYSFTIRYENDMYTLLACDPQLNDTKQLIHELNKTNGLFKFVRKLREKFQEAAPLGFLPQSTTLHQETAISVSAPVFSDVSESPSMTSQTSDELKRNSKRSRHVRGGRQAIMSPVSVRRSPRFKGKK